VVVVVVTALLIRPRPRRRALVAVGAGGRERLPGAWATLVCSAFFREIMVAVAPAPAGGRVAAAARARSVRTGLVRAVTAGQGCLLLSRALTLRTVGEGAVGLIQGRPGQAVQVLAATVALTRAGLVRRLQIVVQGAAGKGMALVAQGAVLRAW